MGNRLLTQNRKILVVGLGGAGKLTLFYKSHIGTMETRIVLNNSMYLYTFVFNYII